MKDQQCLNQWPRVPFNPTRAGLWILFASLCLFANSVRAEIVYDNTQTDFDNMFSPPNTGVIEYGDEVVLGGKARTVTEFQFQYYGEFNAAVSNTTARVRFYANDGPGDPGFQPPGTLLYEGPVQNLFPGFNTLTLTGLSVTVPDDFTWTVEYGGLSGGPNHRAGLSFFNPPTVGSSFSDFWTRTAAGWQPSHFTNFKPVANFAARIMATPDPSLELVSVQDLGKGQSKLEIQGPTYHGGVLEVSLDQTNWTPRHYFMNLGKPIEFVDSQPQPVEQRFYRVNAVADPFLQITGSSVTTNHLMQLRFAGTPGRLFVIDSSADLAHWTPISTNYFTSVFSDFTDLQSSNFVARYYRARFAPDPPMGILSFGTQVGGQFSLMITGAPGRDCLIQSTSDLRNWEPLSTNTFCYTVGGNLSLGALNLLDASATNAPIRMYRALLLP